MIDQRGSQRPYSDKERQAVGRRWDRISTLPFYGDVSLGNATQFKFGLFLTSRQRLFVGIEGHGAYTFAGFTHWSYVQEKLRLMDDDAMNVADFINAQLGHDVEDQGQYREQFCGGYENEQPFS